MMIGTVVDILKQFVVLIISLGFANAFVVFAPQPDFAVTDILAFAIYILVGLRFLAANLLYLAYQYPEGSQKKIYPDACGMITTGILIGLAGSYVNSPATPGGCPAAVCATPPDFDPNLRFYICLLIVLLADAAGSIWSHWANMGKQNGESFFGRLRRFFTGLTSCDRRWILNNVLFAVIIFALLLALWRGKELPGLLSLAVALISLAALGLAFDGLWRLGAFVIACLVAADALMFFLAADAASWLMLVTVVNSVISFLLTYEGCLLADGAKLKPAVPA